MKRWFVRGAALVAVLLVATFAWLRIAPPELLTLGSAYTAKIVCSNVHLAGRDLDEVMRVDVQSPGNPLLKLVSARIEETGDIRVSFPFGIAPGRAVVDADRGCSVLPTSDRPSERSLPLAPVEESDLPRELDPTIQAVLEDDGLVGPGFRAAIVLRDGRIVAERYSEGFDAQTPLLGWSMSKTVTAALIGTAIERGWLSLDDRNLFPDLWTDERREISLADLLGMQSGLEWNEDYGTVSDVTRMLFLEPDARRFVATRDAESAPGTVFEYSTGTTVLIGEVLRLAVERHVNEPIALTAYARDALFRPLGMARTTFEPDVRGSLAAGSFVYATARDWARFARFLLADGVSPTGDRLLPEGFVAWMMEPTEASGGAYGRGQMWRHTPDRSAASAAGLPADTAWMRGHDGQYGAVMPSEGLAVIRLGLTPKREGYSPVELVRSVVEASRAAPSS